ncbi:MAG: Rieske (2Fe-2S) protein [Candidatus Bathyarchaeia archaeon]
MEDEFAIALNESELAEGQMKGVTVDGEPVLLIKKDGKIYAYDDRCPHQQCLISHGTIKRDFVICPCHDWAFKIKTGEYAAEPVITLVPFECKVVAGKIWVKVEVNPQ